MLLLLSILCSFSLFAKEYSIAPAQDQSIDYTKIDIATEPSISTKTSQKVILISYAEGELYKRNQNYLALSALNKGIDAIISYRKQHIDAEFYRAHEHILNQPRGAGYWLWKPYLILETLKMMKENDVLFYVDSGTYLRRPIQPLIDKINEPNVTMLLFANCHSNKCHIKRDAYKLMDADIRLRNAQHLEATFIMIKKTKASVEFVERWLAYCCDEQLLTDAPSKEKEFCNFIDHRHDQAILTLLYHKYPQGIALVSRFKDKTISDLFMVHKRRVADQPITDFKKSIKE